MKKIFLFILLGIHIVSFAQLDYIVPTENGAFIKQVVQADDGEYVGLLVEDSLDYHLWGSMIKFDENFNYIKKDYKSDSLDIILWDFIKMDNGNFLIGGIMGTDEGLGYNATNLYFLVVNEDLDVIKETVLAMPEGYQDPHVRMYRTTYGRNYALVHNKAGAEVKFHAFIELSDEGDIVKQAFYESNGRHIAPFPNPQSDTSFYIMQKSALFTADNEVVEVDTNLNYTVTPLYYEWPALHLGTRGTYKWLNDSVYIIATAYSSDTYGNDLLFYKMSKEHEFLTDGFYIGQPDISDNSLIRRGMDWKDPSRIYVASWYWANFSYALPYYVAVINEDFEVLGSKSIGGDDRNLVVTSLLATDDGGCVMVGSQRDITGGDEWAWDGYVAFYSYEDIVTAAPETPNPYDSDYLLLPNPGRNKLTIQSAREGVSLKMFNQVGGLVFECRLTDDFRNEINTTSLKSGVYLCQLLDKNGNREVKKWIKQ